jgi:transposase
MLNISVGKASVKFLKKNGLKPWRVKSWIIPEAGPDFVCNMEEVVDEYAEPYDPLHPKVCLDESPRQLIGECRKSFTDKNGTEHVDYEYVRNGTVDIFMVTEPPGGHREVFVRDRHTRLEWAEITAYIVEDMFPEAEKITLIQDNLSAHKKSALYELFPPERARAILKKLEFVFTPKHGSWLNVAEIELSVLARQGLKGRIATKDELIRQCDQWCAMRNEKGAGVDWQFTSKDARIKLKRLYPSV